jgi:hypothetical protein
VGVYLPLHHIYGWDLTHIHLKYLLGIHLYLCHHAHHLFSPHVPEMHRECYLALIGGSDNY